MDEETLSKELNNWFKTTNTNKIHFWNRNPVGKVLKDNLIKIEHWKNARRGNPAKGWRERGKNSQ